jgi:cell division septum initiation protein DivIVA
MQAARSLRRGPWGWSPWTIGGRGIALAAIGVWVAALLALMTSTGYDAAAPVFLGPIFIALSLPALVAQARREESDVLLWVLIGALVLKLGSAVARHYVAVDVYSGASDAIGYHEEGLRLRAQFLSGNFNTGLSPLTSTNFIRFLTGVVYTIVGPSKLGGFMAFSWLGFWGQFLFYRAFTIAVPGGRHRTHALLVFFLPSLLFWPSGIGKEAWMLFALGIAAYGAARLLTGSTMRGLLGAGLGLWLAALARPHVAGMAGIALAGAYLLRPAKAELRELAPLAKMTSLVILAVAAVVLIVRTDEFFKRSGIDTRVGVQSVVQDVQARTDEGGSEFEPSPILENPALAPVGIVTVLFRPSILDAHNVQTLVTAAEGTFLLLLSLVRIRWAIAALGSWRRRPYVVFAFLFAGMFVVGFSGVANFGLLARERVQLLPFYLVLFSIPPRKEQAMTNELRRRGAWTTKTIQQTSTGATWRAPAPEEAPASVAAARELRALEARVNELERTLATLPAAMGGPAAVGLDESLEAHPAGSGRRIDLVPEHLHRDAEEAAGRLLAAANAEADRIRAEAQAMRDAARAAADTILEEARAQAEQRLAGAQIDQPLPGPPVLRDAVVGDLQKLSRRVTNALKDLQATIEAADDDRLRAEARSSGKPPRPPSSPSVCARVADQTTS